MRWLIWVCSGIFFSASLQAQAGQEEVERSLAIYANGAQATEIRRLELAGGQQYFDIEGLPRGLDASSLYVRLPIGFSLLSQSFDPALLNRHELLRRHLGLPVKLARINPANGAETIEEAVLLAIDDGPILKIGERIETDPPGRIIFSANQLVAAKPLLRLGINSEKAARSEMRLSYLLDDLSWQAEYLADLDSEKKLLNLSARFAIANNSGSDFSKTRLYLIAGEINRALPPPVSGPKMAMSSPAAPMRAAMMTDSVPSASVEELGAHQLFMPHGQSHFILPAGRVTQLRFFEARNIAYEEELVSHGQGVPTPLRNGVSVPTHPRLVLSFKNEEKAIGLATPLPGGTLLATEKSRDGAMLFAGSNRLSYTPSGGQVKLELGSAGDVGVTRVRTDFTRPDNERRHETAWRIEVSNAREGEAKIRLVEPIGGDWQILSESHPHRKIAADRAEWLLPVPGKGKVIVEYRVRVRQ
jgi:hypothetical protein